MKKNNTNSLALKMSISLALGLLFGGMFILLREYLLNTDGVALWTSIDNILFRDISKPEGKDAIGLFYIIGQLFINSLQLIIVPMVFTSIALAMCKITDTKKLGRISSKTLLGFLGTSLFSLILAGVFALIAHNMGLFDVAISNVQEASGTISSNPLLVFVQAIPSNITSVFSENGRVLSVVFLAVATGLCINKLGDEIKILKKILEEVNKLIAVFLSFVITKFGPFAIFILITRTFAIYGVEHLKPALTYVIIATVTLLLFLIFGYALFIFVTTKLNPFIFIKKILKVALFGFSTSSSASTLPLNTETTVNELGVDKEIASFTLPLGMTINMNGTAIMQVIAAVFIASSAGYELNLVSVITIGVLALISSIGTPAAPGAGAIILFTVLTGMGYNNDSALLAYSLILAINRPVEMLVTSLNVVGDAATSVYVAKSENMLDVEVYNA